MSRAVAMLGNKSLHCEYGHPNTETENQKKSYHKIHFGPVPALFFATRSSISSAEMEFSIEINGRLRVPRVVLFLLFCSVIFSPSHRFFPPSLASILVIGMGLYAVPARVRVRGDFCRMKISVGMAILFFLCVCFCPMLLFALEGPFTPLFIHFAPSFSHSRSRPVLY